MISCRGRCAIISRRTRLLSHLIRLISFNAQETDTFMSEKVVILDTLYMPIVKNSIYIVPYLKVDSTSVPVEIYLKRGNEIRT